jgi:hydroxymethylglutaryl-CoA lyase
MSDLPKSIAITEEGPREGFQIEPGPIAARDKAQLINALSTTGLKRIQTVSFVNAKRVPGMADAEQVVAQINPVEGVEYTALWYNAHGLERARATNKLHLEGKINLYASDQFLSRNLNRTPEEHLAEVHRNLQLYRTLGIPVESGTIAAAFGCNFAHDIPAERVLKLVRDILHIAAEHSLHIRKLNLADTMAWATPKTVKNLVGKLRDRFPDLAIELHLHDTRGLGIANAFAGMQMGVARFDSAVAGLGGCPFAAHKGAAGNVCTEDLVFMCEEMGISTGVDLQALIECALLAERIVGHALPGSVMKGGSLTQLRAARQVPQ